MAIVSSSLDPENTFRVLGTMPQNVNFAVKSSLVKNMIPMLPETLAAPTGIVVVPTDIRRTTCPNRSPIKVIGDCFAFVSSIISSAISRTLRSIPLETLNT